jgi:hypothetical protein
MTVVGFTGESNPSGHLTHTSSWSPSSPRKVITALPVPSVFPISLLLRWTSAPGRGTPLSASTLIATWNGGAGGSSKFLQAVSRTTTHARMGRIA